MALRPVNAVIVGAGAGGGVVAKELACAGLSVVLLDRGKRYSAADCRKDDLRNQRTTVLGNGFGPDDERNPRVLVDERGEHIVSASESAYSNNAACVGGGTFSYGAQAWRFMEKDFRMRSTYGAMAGSTLEDWPISYSDLEPFYEKAEWEMGVSGDDTDNIFKAPRRKPPPMPPLPPTREHRGVWPAPLTLGTFRTPSRMSIKMSFPPTQSMLNMSSHCRRSSQCRSTYAWDPRRPTSSAPKKTKRSRNDRCSFGRVRPDSRSTETPDALS
jgi:choline dehydrogenase-like flavoprotein